MLFLLSGAQQSGKTRWLQALVEELEEEGVPCLGVLAPGRWHQGPRGLEKAGIDNLLLPDHRLLPFAEGARGQADGRCAQSRAAGLGWDISDAALEEVNAHLARLAEQHGERNSGLLVVDELGPLELRCGGGLHRALDLLEAGPRPGWPHAVVVVRPALLKEANERFRTSWGDPEPLEPSEGARLRVRGLLAS